MSLFVHGITLHAPYSLQGGASRHLYNTILSRGMGAWDELLKTEADIRKNRQKLIYEQQELRQKWIEGIAISLLVIVILGFLTFLGYLWYNRY